MGTTQTPNLGLIKPDGTEPASNWPTQHGANADTLDGQFFEHLQIIAEASNGVNRDFTSDDTAFVGFGDGVVFTAPRSGKVLIIFYDHLITEKPGSGSLINRTAIASARVGTGNVIGSGTEVLAPDLNGAIKAGTRSTNNDGVISSGSSYIVLNGLTPGNEYNVEHQYRINTSTMNLARSDDRKVTVLAAT